MTDKWKAVRRQFRLNSDLAHFATLVFTSHPTPVATAIQYHRDMLDAEGFRYFMEESAALKLASLEAAARYFCVPSGLVALTTGTTMGLAQVLGGVKMRPDQHMLTSINEHPAIVETLKLRGHRDGRQVFGQVPLFKNSRHVTSGEILANLERAITVETRVLALTWVYSSDGVKLPIAEIASLVATVNANRKADDRLLFFVDGVHGFGIEDVTFPLLDCDVFVAGCHKSLFGPRGTGVIYGKASAWAEIVPLVALLAGSGGAKNPAWEHIPGGVRAYEHQWALAAAFDYHIGVLRKPEVHARIRNFVRSFRTELTSIPKVTVVTPDAPELTSGLICLDVEGYTAAAVVEELKRDGVIASTSAPDRSGVNPSHVRFAVSVLNDDADFSRVSTALRRL